SPSIRTAFTTTISTAISSPIMAAPARLWPITRSRSRRRYAPITRSSTAIVTKRSRKTWRHYAASSSFERPRAVSFQHRAEAREHRRFDFGILFEPAQDERCGFQRGQALAPRLAPEPAVERRPLRIDGDAPALEHPRVAPPQCFGLAPGAVEHDDAVE